MIKIRITDKAEYSRLRNEYLEIISEYVAFDKEDVLYDLKPEEEDKKESDQTVKLKGRRKYKTKKTARELKKVFQQLYRFLFEENSGRLKRENLRYLLAGPDEMPHSFGGSSGKRTMRECLEEIIHEVEKDGVTKDGDEKTKIKECCQKIFNYDKFVGKQDDAYLLLRKLDVRTCPYCNRAYTVTLPSRKELKNGEEFVTTRATYDHFYSRDKFPYFAVSLFNLIPSCHTCNFNKNNSDKKIVYPYDEEFGEDVVFRVLPNLEQTTEKELRNVLNYLHGRDDRFYIRFIRKGTITLHGDAPLEDRLDGMEDRDFQERIRESIEGFRLEKLYTEHKLEIMDILRNRYYFDDEYIKTAVCPMLRKKMKKKYDANIKEEELERMAMDMLFFTRVYRAEWGKRPLSKLVADILDQLSD